MTTQTEQFDPRELRLTAYALDELDDADRQAVEADLADDADGRAFVERVRTAAQSLADELQREPAPAPLTDLRRAIEDRIEQRSRIHRRPIRQRPLIWMPVGVFIAIAVVLAVACAAVFLMMQ